MKMLGFIEPVPDTRKPREKNTFVYILSCLLFYTLFTFMNRKNILIFLGGLFLLVTHIWTLMEYIRNE